MAETITVAEFKVKCLALLDEVQQTRKEYFITKRGKPVARLVPTEAKRRKVFGRLNGTVKIHGDIFSAGERWENDA